MIFFKEVEDFFKEVEDFQEVEDFLKNRGLSKMYRIFQRGRGFFQKSSFVTIIEQCMKCV